MAQKKTVIHPTKESINIYSEKKKKKKKKNRQLNSLKCRLAFFGQSNNFVWPIFAVLGPLPLTDRAKGVRGCGQLARFFGAL